MTPPQAYTTSTYWESYYRDSVVSREHITRVCGQYDVLWDRLIAACQHPPQSIIEIGAYPGRYIAYLSARYGLEATALDYNPDRRKIDNAFFEMGVTSYHVLQADFLHHTPSRQYDIVLSNGFVEHFQDFDAVLDRHCDYLAPTGALFIMIPNLRYLRHIYGWLVDYSNLRQHNLRCMTLTTFQRFAARNRLRIAHTGYFGGFSYGVHQSLNLLQKAIYQVCRGVSRRANGWIAATPNRLLSSSLYAIATREETPRMLDTRNSARAT